MKKLLLLGLVLAPFTLFGAELPVSVQKAANDALSSYSQATVDTLSMLVSFPTVHEEGKKNRDLSSVKAMSKYLKKKASELGFEFKDFGDVVVISMGNQKERLGLITHGDVQPAEAIKWIKGPFVLDLTSEPGKLIGRGAEDDKGSIALALYAMKAVHDQKLPLKRRIELIISYTEESDWDPMEEFLKKNPPPELNVAFDADYPVVVAQKGWGKIALTVTNTLPSPLPTQPFIQSLSGGAFMSQVPEEAEAVIANATPQLAQDLQKLSKKFKKVQFTFEQNKTTLKIHSKGLSSHSASPENGVNAIVFLGELLAKNSWVPTPTSTLVSFIHDLIGTGHYAEKFGKIAFKDSFMGPLTMNLSMVTEKEGKLTLAINIRSPRGKEKAQLEKEIQETVSAWKEKYPAGQQATLDLYVGEAHFQKDAPHVPELLNIFSFYTGEKNPKPISVGGGTHARLVPHGVDFGPAMPNVPYTGHSEHEFITTKQLELNLKMYTAMIATLGSH